MATTFDEFTRNLLDGRNFATVATLQADGSPQTSVVWIKRDGDTVMFSTLERRKKARNIARDPRVSLSVYATENPYSSVEIRGVAEMRVDEGKKLPYELSHKYLSQDPPHESDDMVRMSVRVTPEKVIAFSA